VSQLSTKPPEAALSARVASRLGRAQHAGPPRIGDFLFQLGTTLCAIVVVLVVLGILVELVRNSWLSLNHFGLRFLASEAWNPVKSDYGAASSIFGTVVSTIIAMVLAVPLSLVTALFLVDLAPPRLSRFVGGALELLAAIPSIIYGMWGLFVFAPFMAKYVQPLLQETVGRTWLLGSLFQGKCMGVGMLTAGIILALMILPYICAVSRDVFAMTPPLLKESAYGMGATTWEVTRQVTIRYGLRGIVGAMFLGLGRAIGETMAVTFVIGNDHKMSGSLFAAGNTISSTLANEFAEASEPLYVSALIELGLVLFLVTVLFQGLAYLWLGRLGPSGGPRR
jgi:phosphate transport system permease protein